MKYTVVNLSRFIQKNPRLNFFVYTLSYNWRYIISSIDIHIKNQYEYSKILLNLETDNIGIIQHNDSLVYANKTETFVKIIDKLNGNLTIINCKKNLFTICKYIIKRILVFLYLLNLHNETFSLLQAKNAYLQWDNFI